MLKEHSAWLLSIVYLVLYISLQTQSIYGGDAGDLVTAAFTKGVAHPPGYPLYTIVGYVLTKVTVGTIAWRVTLLSSIFSALTIGLCFSLLQKLIRRTIPSLIAVSILGFSYIFWLYAEVPEVFALNNFFIASIIYLLLQWQSTNNKKYFACVFLIFGLSLSHHQFILFFTPAICFWIYHNKSFLKTYTIKFWIWCAALLVTGLLPYLYVYFAAVGIPPLNWENPVTFSNFIRLVTRAYYGTFRSSSNVQASIIDRLDQFKFYGEMMREEFTYFGILIILFGLFHLFQSRKNRQLLIFLLIGIFFLGPFFLFYAAFPLYSRFWISTVERFLPASYLFLTVIMGFGITYLSDRFFYFLKFIFKRNISRRFRYVAYSLFVLLPVSLMYINLPKIYSLRSDFSAEDFAQDLLNTADKNSIVLPVGDIALFSAQYLYYTQRVRPDIVLLHTTKITNPQYKKQAEKYYPFLRLQDDDSYGDMTRFIEDNYMIAPIYSNLELPLNLDDGYWVQFGLLARFYKKKDLPPKEFVIQENQRLWKSYHKPQPTDIKFKNLTLSSILDNYAYAHIATGKLFYRLNIYEDALVHFDEAIKLQPKESDNYYYIGRIYLLLNQCQKAANNFQTAIDLDTRKVYNYFYLGRTYKDCFNDEKKASDYQKIFEQLQQSKETPLDQL